MQSIWFVKGSKELKACIEDLSLAFLPTNDMLCSRLFYNVC